MVLIYTEKTTPRITYTFKQVLGRILGLEIGFTSKVETFVAHKDLKFSYGRQRLGDGFFVQAAGLLQDQGLTDTEIPVQKWDNLPCFYRTGNESDIPFDIFSASFFMLSRYEEYLPHVKDAQGRYPVEECLAFKNGFLRRPVVDLWAQKFKDAFQEHFPDAAFPAREFKVKNILAVAEAYKYKGKGLMRNIGGGVSDLFGLKIKALYERLKTQVFLTKDPYNIYGELIKFSKQRHILWHFMFQLSDYSFHSKNIGHNKLKYHALIKSMGDYGKTGLLIGYEALHVLEILKKEKKRWENILNRDLDMAMSTDYDLNLPKLYDNYDTLEIGQDFSMGFTEKIGFRAGTCTPFLYYDLNFERISPLVINPVACNSQCFKPSSFFEVKTILGKVKKEVENVNGTLILLFKNSDFQYNEKQEKYFQLLEKMNEY